MELKLKSRNILMIGYTNYISLPKFWLTHYNLGKGSSIAITVSNDGKLILEPNSA